MKEIELPTLNRTTLEMALAGYEVQAANIQAAMAAIRKELGIHGPRGSAGPKRVLSPSARKRMADAQKRRWAAFHAKQAAPKRKLSAATRAKLAANLAKARAAKAAKAAA